ncbi:protein of unknown function DUF6 transmembrane [Denitrovibrio acetiphilus DSM 12809]|uniref:EamA domain-containing protein n=1 Tax=Denitrovibrio acetiphilus (strain DSM 12809 / NBRC 114555 / N2460) TaxID=522772 RepID=D4H1M6_DENA2|nr:DMT family transporter [Denitrovibrio acetiphilus]ADD68786.1 protein of unknown function DUF6 transmembrane [Denitrovibrio acetiphilus DSM 12809]
MTTYTKTKAKFDALGEEFRGVLIMFVAAFFFSTMGYFTKMLTAHHNAFEIVFFRNIVSFAILGVLMLMFRTDNAGGKPLLLIMRGFFGFISMFCFFYSISVLPFATASTFHKTSPIFTAVFAGLVLKEKSGLKVWLAILVGFAGVLLVLRPSHIDHVGAVVGLCGGIIAAMAYTSVRGLAKYYDARTIVMSFSLAGLVGSSLYFLIRYLAGDPRYHSTQFIPTGIDIFYMILVGVLALIAQWLMSVAYKYGRASVISTVNYVGIIFATVFGYIAGDGWPGLVSMLGIFFVGASGVMVGLSRKN